MWSSLNTGTASSPTRSVRNIVSPRSVRCRMKTSVDGVRNVSENVEAGPPPSPRTSAKVTVYSVSSNRGRVKRTPTLRPDVSTENGVDGLTVI